MEKEQNNLTVPTWHIPKSKRHNWRVTKHNMGEEFEFLLEILSQIQNLLRKADATKNKTAKRYFKTLALAKGMYMLEVLQMHLSYTFEDRKYIPCRNSQLIEALKKTPRNKIKLSVSDIYKEGLFFFTAKHHLEIFIMPKGLLIRQNDIPSWGFEGI